VKILILGSDGYIGYPLTIHLLKEGYEVLGVDDLSRRERVYNINSDSLTPILSPTERKQYLRYTYKNFVDQICITLGVDVSGLIKGSLREFKPNAIIHLAEMPSAPWSMRSASHAGITQYENVVGTLHLLWAMKEVCPEAHLVKLGTMGEYGTPNCDIPEGRIPKDCIGNYRYQYVKDKSKWPPDKFDEAFYECPMKGLLFPRTAGSFYHLSKVHDTHNIEFACRNWGLRSTDIMQGVVYGLPYKFTNYGIEELTRFDYDEYFGTAINRFCAQAISNHHITVYGEGEQTRGFLTLNDSISCLTLAIKNPPEEGEYRTFNQFEDKYSINDLARIVQREAGLIGFNVSIVHIANPRKELEDHYYNPTHQKLFDLGYVPSTNIQNEVALLLRKLSPYKDRVRKEVIMPKTSWR